MKKTLLILALVSLCSMAKAQAVLATDGGNGVSIYYGAEASTN